MVWASAGMAIRECNPKTWSYRIWSVRPGRIPPHRKHAVQRAEIRHLAPHPKQDIKWVESDDQGNIERLIEKHYSYMVKEIPEIEDLQYDFHRKRFETAEGKDPIDKADLRAIAAFTGRRGKAGAGGTTLARAVVAHSLLQRKGSEERNAILAQLTRERGTDVANHSLEGILYSPTPQPNATEHSSIWSSINDHVDAVRFQVQDKLIARLLPQ